MLYGIQFAVFLLSIILAIAFIASFVLKWALFHKKYFKVFCVFWFVLYIAYIFTFTGPVDFSLYPPNANSPYMLPWKPGVSRFVAQGNRSFVSHRDFHYYAWDFVMPNGTNILAARSGKVLQIADSLSGIGLHSNFIILEHDDGERSVYAHIKQNGSLVQVGDTVLQGQPIALSGMVGQTLFPHVHFYVIGKDGESSIPVSFKEVPNGVPLAGRFYTSENEFK